MAPKEYYATLLNSRVSNSSGLMRASLSNIQGMMPKPNKW